MVHAGTSGPHRKPLPSKASRLKFPQLALRRQQELVPTASHPRHPRHKATSRSNIRAKAPADSLSLYRSSSVPVPPSYFFPTVQHNKDQRSPQHVCWLHPSPLLLTWAEVGTLTTRLSPPQTSLHLAQSRLSCVRATSPAGHRAPIPQEPRPHWQGQPGSGLVSGLGVPPCSGYMAGPGLLPAASQLGLSVLHVGSAARSEGKRF